MPSRLSAYHRPAVLAEAKKLMSEGAHALTLSPRPRPNAYSEVEAVVDLADLPLAYIEQADDRSMRIGGQTTLQQIAESAALNKQANGLLNEAAAYAAGMGLRHVATAAGALTEPESAPELLIALLAVEAVVVFEDGQTVALGQLAEGVGQSILTEIRFNDHARSNVGAALQRVARTPRDRAVVAAAAVVESEKGICRRARLAMAGVGAAPFRLTSVESVLEGKKWTDEKLQAAGEAVSASVEPESDFRGSAEYRKAIAGVVARRALSEALKRAIA